MIEDLWRAIKRLEESLIELRKRVQDNETHRDEDLFEVRLAIARLENKHASD